MGKRYEVICYHRGNLAEDRVGTHWRSRQISKTAGEWMAASLRGECVLLQRRMGDNSFEYLAIKEIKTE